MWSLLDTIGSTAIGGAVILLVITINLQMNSTSSELYENNIIQANSTESAEIIKYDFYKIGYHASGEKITAADSNAIVFVGDINNDNSVDTISYAFTALNDTIQVNNPNKVLNRTLNNENPEVYSLLSDFKLTYFDSLGAEISYGSLNSAVNRNKIRSIKVEMTHSSSYQVNNMFQESDWASIIRPKNLR